MCEPAIRGIKRLYPSAALSLLVKPAIGDLFTGHPAVDQIIVYDWKERHAGLIGKWTLARELRNGRFDVAVLFQNAFEAALLAYLAGIPSRHGYATDGRTFLLSDPISVSNRRGSVHQVHYYWNLLRPLGLSGEPDAPKLSLLPEESQAIDERLLPSGIRASDLIVGINPGSTYGGAKRWLPARFAEAAARLCRQVQEGGNKRVAVVIIGAKGEEAIGAEIAGQLTVPVVVLSGATTIRQLMAAVARCSILLTNDTGPMHIAAAMNVPVVAIFGPTDWKTTSPVGEIHTLVRHPVDCAPCMLRECPIDHRCMTGVSVQHVLEAATPRLPASFGLRDLTGIGPQGADSSLKEIKAEFNILEGTTIFLDRDGTLNVDPGYLKSAADLKLLPGVPEALARFKAAGARLVVVTNQSGVARGFLTLKDLDAIHARLQGLLEQHDAALDAIYFCPHHPDDGCLCRKPGRGMVDRAVAELQLDLKKSYVIGDHARDMQLARIIGARAVLVTGGVVDAPALEALKAEQAMPDAVAATMTEAVEWILRDASQAKKAETVSEPVSGRQA